MRAGQLRRQVVLEQPSTVKDAAGQVIESWTEVATVYAEIQQLTGREVLAATGKVSIVDAQIDMRYRDGLSPAMRARYRGQIYNIAAIIDVDTRHETTRLLCATGANRG